MLSIGGFLRVDGGTVLESSVATVGKPVDLGGPGLVTVTGKGSAWYLRHTHWGPGALQAGGYLSDLGQYGAGAVEVLAGGRLSVEGSAAFGSVGVAYDWGTLTVSGAESLFTANDLTLRGTDSSLSVTDGGAVRMATPTLMDPVYLPEPYIYLYSGAGLFLEGAGSEVSAEALLVNPDHSSTLSAVTIGSGALLRLNLGIALNARFGQVSALDLRGGRVEITNSVRNLYVDNDADINGYGTFHATLDLPANLSLRSHGGTLTVGDPSDHLGFRSQGLITVESGSTLALQSYRNFAQLGALTELEGGTLTANSGLTLDVGRGISGHGAVATRLSALQGSTIDALGDLSLGDPNAYDGFFSNALLAVNEHTVTLLDKNAAELGSLTTVGSAAGPGTLNAPKGILVDFGRTLSGHGEVNADILNNGLVDGSGPQPGDYLALNGTVRGVGAFAGTIMFGGGLSPGLSPTQTVAENVAFGPASVLEMELAGLTPGADYDQILASGTVFANGKLKVTLLDSFLPQFGNVFDLIVAQELLGRFAVTEFPTLTPDLRWNLQYAPGEANGDVLRLAVRAVPLPPAVWALLGALTVLGTFARRTRGPRPD